MNHSTIKGLLAATVSVALLALLPAQAQTGPAAATAPGGAASAAAGASSSGDDMMAMMRQNNDKMMAMKPTGDPDVDFAMMMRMHHMGGIQMAEHEMKNGKNAEIRKMARKIRDSQKKEAAQFERFLARKGHPVSR